MLRTGIGGAVSQALNSLTLGHSTHLHVDGGQISDIPLHTKSQPQRHTLKQKISPDFTLTPFSLPSQCIPQPQPIDREALEQYQDAM